MSRKCDLCSRPALTRTVDAEDGTPVRPIVDVLGVNLPILDTVRPVTVIQEKFCRFHRKKVLREMAQEDYLEEVIDRPYLTTDMTDAEPGGTPEYAGMAFGDERECDEDE